MASTTQAFGIAVAAGAASSFLTFMFLRRPPLQLIQAAKAAPPGGYYSQAVKYNGLVHVSGILPVIRTAEGKGMKLNDRPFDEQVAAVLDNLGAIIEEAGSEPSKLVSVRVYITDIEKWGEFNALYEKFVGAHKPARAVVPVPTLHYGFQIELEAIASY